MLGDMQCHCGLGRDAEEIEDDVMLYFSSMWFAKYWQPFACLCKIIYIRKRLLLTWHLRSDSPHVSFIFITYIDKKTSSFFWEYVFLGRTSTG